MDTKQVLVPSIQQMSDFGTGEPFVARIPLGLCELLNGVNIDEVVKKEMENNIFETFQELSHAFIALRDIKDMETGVKPKLLVNLKKAYEDFYGYCWASYKDRMPKILKAVDIDIGFIFGKDKANNEGLIEFKHLYPIIGDEFTKMISDDRKAWQSAVSHIRNNYIEHKQSNQMSDVEMKKYFNLDTAQLVFENCWQAIEDIVVMCLTVKLLPGIRIGRIPVKDIDEKCPKKFCFYAIE